MLFVDAVIYAIIAWYMEHVKPGPYGQARPFYFPFLVRQYSHFPYFFLKKNNIFPSLLSGAAAGTIPATRTWEGRRTRRGGGTGGCGRQSRRGHPGCSARTSKRHSGKTYYIVIEIDEACF